MRGVGTSRTRADDPDCEADGNFVVLANSMDRSHRQKLSDSRIAVRNGSLVITTDCPESIVLEQYSFDQKADFFEEVFGIRPVLRQKRGV